MTPTTAFQPGQTVRARETVQGLVAGDLYRVATVAERDTPFGTFVTYFVKPIDCVAADRYLDLLAVANGHLVLEAA